MEAQEDSIEFSNIKKLALGVLDPSQLHLLESERAQTDQVTTCEPHETPRERVLAFLPQPELSSTVPDSQGQPHNDDLTLPKGSLSQPQPRLTVSESPEKKMSSGSVPGDTQPISQSVYDSIVKKSRTLQQSLDASPEAQRVSRLENGDTQRTLYEGDEGHIDLLGGYEAARSSPQCIHGDDAEDSEAGDFSPTQDQSRVEHFPESQRFRTPATVGKKRNYLGETVDSPSLPRKSPGAMMGLSQIFNATQAPSSPFANGLPVLGNGPPSGPMSDRPSPNIELETRPATATGLSSPLREGYRRSKSEPYTKYKSMKQSQAEREKLAEIERLTSDVVEGDDFADFEEDSYIRRQERLKKRNEETMRQFAEVIASTRPSSRGVGASVANDAPKALNGRNGLPSFASSPPNKVGVVDQTRPLANISEDELFNVGGVHDNVSEEETEQEDEGGAAFKKPSQRSQPGGEEDKENIDVSAVEVPNTVPRFIRPEDGEDSPDSSPTLRRTDGTRDHSFAVANSQTSQPHNGTPRVLSQAAAVQPPSSADSQSFVPQSQIEERVGTTPFPPRSLTELQQSTIPETSPAVQAGPDHPTGSSSVPAPSTKPVGITATSSETTNFETAHSHLTAPSTQPAAVPSLLASPSGRRLFRSVAEIGADPSPQNSGQEVDPDVSMPVLKDKEYDEVMGMSSPIAPGRKKRRTNDSHPLPTGETRHASSSERADKVVQNVETSASSRGEETVRPPADYSSGLLRNSRSRMPRSAGNVWEPDASPPKPAVKARKLGTQRPASSRPSRQISPISSPRPEEHSPDNSPPSNGDEAPRPQPTAHDEPTDGLEQPDIGPESEITAPNQVFALFKGIPRGYYPGTCIGRSSDSKRFIIRWEGDDFPNSEVDEHGVQSLELRLGDMVKVNLKGFSSTPYVVRGFKDKILLPSRTSTGDIPMTDIHGYSTLVLVSKKRKSMADDATEFKAAPVGAVYLDGNMWAQHKDRDFAYAPFSGQPGVQTPSERPSTPSVAPGSRSRRDTVLAAGSKLALTPATTGIFSGMIFAISYDDELRRSTLIRQIESNGGQLLKEGFDDLFKISPQHPPKSTAEDAEVPSAGNTFSLTPEATNLGFAAVLAQAHSRKPKYMQALALGLPCLHVRWAEDCISKGALQQWTPYLLPAGESRYLDNAIRSRVLAPTDPQTAKLSDTIASRSTLLQAQSVLVIIGRGNAEMRQRACLFLLAAMGAGKVEKANDVKAAKALVGQQQWDWVLVDKAHVKEVEALFSGMKQRDGAHRPEAVENEHVFQSLILGQVLEE